MPGIIHQTSIPWHGDHAAVCTGAPASSAAMGSAPLGACVSQPLYQSSGIGRFLASSARGVSQRSACTTQLILH